MLIALFRDKGVCHPVLLMVAPIGIAVCKKLSIDPVPVRQGDRPPVSLFYARISIPVFTNRNMRRAAS